MVATASAGHMLAPAASTAAKTTSDPPGSKVAARKLLKNKPPRPIGPSTLSSPEKSAQSSRWGRVVHMAAISPAKRNERDSRLNVARRDARQENWRARRE